MRWFVSICNLIIQYFSQSVNLSGVWISICWYLHVIMLYTNFWHKATLLTFLLHIRHLYNCPSRNVYFWQPSWIDFRILIRVYMSSSPLLFHTPTLRIINICRIWFYHLTDTRYLNNIYHQIDAPYFKFITWALHSYACNL